MTTQTSRAINFIREHSTKQRGGRRHKCGRKHTSSRGNGKGYINTVNSRPDLPDSFKRYLKLKFIFVLQ